jgi:hypothetical protein
MIEQYADIAARYKRMRAASRSMNDELMKLGMPFVKQAAKELGVWVRGTIVMDMEELPVLTDRTIYCFEEHGRNAVEHYADEHPAAAGSDAQVVLDAMRKAFFSVFQVRDMVEGVGLHVADILRDREHFLADVNLSRTARKGVVLASRVLPFDDFIMTTGAALPVDGDSMVALAAVLDRLGASCEEMRALPDEISLRLETMIMGACLHGDQAQMQYRDADEDAGTSERSATSKRVGRNDPCPCGSGRKYKKCCGR